MKLTKQEETAIQKFEQARVKWWLYTPSELKAIERDAMKVYKKLEKQEAKQ